MMRVKGQMSQMMKKEKKSLKYQIVRKERVKKKVKRMKVKGQKNQMMMKEVGKRVKGMIMIALKKMIIVDIREK